MRTTSVSSRQVATEASPNLFPVGIRQRDHTKVSFAQWGSLGDTAAPIWATPGGEDDWQAQGIL